MFARLDKSGIALALAIAVAVLVLAIPTCQMVGCDMAMSGGMMAISTHTGLSFGEACGGAWVSSTAPLSTPPTEFMVAFLVLLGVLAASARLSSSRVEFRPVRLVDANAPSPPLDPRGERFII